MQATTSETVAVQADEPVAILVGSQVAAAAGHPSDCWPERKVAHCAWSAAVDVPGLSCRYMRVSSAVTAAESALQYEVSRPPSAAALMSAHSCAAWLAVRSSRRTPPSTLVAKTYGGAPPLASPFPPQAPAASTANASSGITRGRFTTPTGAVSLNHRRPARS